MAPRPSMRHRTVALSALLHLLLFAPFLIHHRIHAIPIRNPGTSLGTRVMLTYSPGRAPLHTPATIHSHTRPTPTPPRLASTAVSPNADSSQGAGARGSGNVTVALATFFPWPRPEIPHGTRGDVVVDVTIDEQGKIVESQIATSMGPAIDSLVLATIQTWTFKPATKDGIPIPSEQELLFHYERG